MEKQQIIEIAKAAFPENVKQFIDFDSIAVTHRAGVYRMYDKNNPNDGRMPDNCILNIFIEGNFIQLDPKFRAFNHYAAIKKMEDLKLI